MGMTYEELSVYGRLRKIFRCGPVSMYQVSFIFFFFFIFMMICVKYSIFIMNIFFSILVSMC